MRYRDQLKALLHPQTPETVVTKVPKAPFVTYGTSGQAPFAMAGIAEAFEERAGILQFDAGLSRADAEDYAAWLLQWRPSGQH